LQGVVLTDRPPAVDGLIAHFLNHSGLLENRLGQQVLEAGLVQQRSQALVVGLRNAASCR